MANEIRFATLATDARYAALIGAAFFMMFEDPGAFPKSEIWHYAGSVEGSMSDTIQTTIYGHGGNPMTDTPEGTAATNTALALANVTVTAARKTLRREVGDLAKMTDAHGVFSSSMLAFDALGGFNLTLLDLACAVIDGFTGVETATGTMDYATHQAAVERMVSQGRKPIAAVYHSVQWAQLQTDLGNQTGRITFQAATDELIRVKGPGYQGSLNGVEIYANDRVSNAGGKYKGALLAKNALVYCDGKTPVDAADPTALDIGGKVVLESVRDADAGETAYVSSAWIGVAMGVDDCGVTVQSDS